MRYPFFLQHMKSNTMYKVCSEDQGVKIDKYKIELDPPEITLWVELQKKAELLGQSVFIAEKLVPVTEGDYLDRLSDFNDQICKRTIKL